MYCECKSRWRKYSWKRNGSFLWNICMYCDESLIVRLKKKLWKHNWHPSSKLFSTHFYIVKSFFNFFTENMNNYKALVITLHLCNSLRCKLTHMGFELELGFTYTCTMVGMSKFCPEIIRHFFLLNQQKSDSNTCKL